MYFLNVFLFLYVGCNLDNLNKNIKIYNFTTVKCFTYKFHNFHQQLKLKMKLISFTYTISNTNLPNKQKRNF